MSAVGRQGGPGPPAPEVPAHSYLAPCPGSYVYQDFFYSGGHMWPYFAHRVVGCLALMTTFSASMLAIKKLYSSGAILFLSLNTILWWFKGCAPAAGLAASQGPPPRKNNKSCGHKLLPALAAATKSSPPCPAAPQPPGVSVRLGAGQAPGRHGARRPPLRGGPAALHAARAAARREGVVPGPLQGLAGVGRPARGAVRESGRRARAGGGRFYDNRAKQWREEVD